MSSIVQVKVGKYTYLYESESYRNENGEPRNNRKIIGKVDPATGRYIFKQEYLERMNFDASMGTSQKHSQMKLRIPCMCHRHRPMGTS